MRRSYMTFYQVQLFYNGFKLLMYWTIPIVTMKPYQAYKYFCLNNTLYFPLSQLETELWMDVLVVG